MKAHSRTKWRSDCLLKCVLLKLYISAECHKAAWLELMEAFTSLLQHEIFLHHSTMTGNNDNNHCLYNCTMPYSPIQPAEYRTVQRQRFLKWYHDFLCCNLSCLSSSITVVTAGTSFVLSAQPRMPLHRPLRSQCGYVRPATRSCRANRPHLACCSATH